MLQPYGSRASDNLPLTIDVRVISLGSWCGVKTALRNLGLDGPSFPFDWIRSSVECVIDCLENNFATFLMWEQVQDSPYKDHATPHGRIYSAWGHSFWHDNLEDIEDREKMKRRLQRFRQLEEDDSTLLFVRSLSTTRELCKAERLMEMLLKTFGKAKTFLLLLVDVQTASTCILFEETPCLIIHKIDLVQGQTGQKYAKKYHAAICDAVDYATRNVRPLKHVVYYSVDDFLRSSLLRHVSLGEDLAVPWCHDPCMPPPQAFKDAASSCIETRIVAEQEREHRDFCKERPSGMIYPIE